jgi:dynein heavy chain
LLSINDAEHTVKALQATLAAWLKCQAGWLYLGPVFGSEDAVHQMPNEGRKFQAVDAIWRAIMVKLYKTSEVIVVAANAELLRSLEEANGLLNQVLLAANLCMILEGKCHLKGGALVIGACSSPNADADI